jgi:hypothetical protein
LLEAVKSKSCASLAGPTREERKRWQRLTILAGTEANWPFSPCGRSGLPDPVSKSVPIGKHEVTGRRATVSDPLKRSLFGHFPGKSQRRRTRLRKALEGASDMTMPDGGQALRDDRRRPFAVVPWAPARARSPNLFHNRTGCSKSWQDSDRGKRQSSFAQRLTGIEVPTRWHQKNAKQTCSALHSR